MHFEKAKKSLISVKLISYIIINILKLRELHTSIESSNILNKINLVKDFAKFATDILSFNIMSIVVNSLPYYNKIKKIKNYIESKIKKGKNE
jgi:hypothetical protein